MQQTRRQESVRRAGHTSGHLRVRSGRILSRTSPAKIFSVSDILMWDKKMSIREN
jgi:hypothetical protein